MLAVIVATALMGAGQADEPPFSAKQLYVACDRYLRQERALQNPDGSYGATAPEQCGMISIQALSTREGVDSPGPHFCLPDTLKQGISFAMARAYLRFFERSGSKWPSSDGRPVYVQAMLETWPCR